MAIRIRHGGACIVIVPVSAIIATRNRAELCRQLIGQLEAQEYTPAEIVVCDSSDVSAPIHRPSVRHLKASQRGAAPQRNEAIAASTQPNIWLLDDDITLEPDCLKHIWTVLANHPTAGGVTATIVNEAYCPPGRWTRALLKWFEGGRQRMSYAGCCVGPGMTFWPADDSSLPEAVNVEWMGAGCSLYRRSVLPEPPFDSIFQEASLCEDLALSLRVAKEASLLQATRARFIHLNVGGSHKRNTQHLAAMNVVNRYYVMTRIMGKRSARDHLQFGAMFVFNMLGVLRQSSALESTRNLIGTIRGCLRLCLDR